MFPPDGNRNVISNNIKKYGAKSQVAWRFSMTVGWDFAGDTLFFKHIDIFWLVVHSSRQNA
jgi:hypothetical protein